MTQRRCSCSAGVPGNSEAVWASAPIPNRIRSKRGQCSKDGAQFILVLLCGLCRIELALQAMHVLRREVDVRQQGTLGHAVIAVGMIRRDTALVTPEDVHVLPFDRLRDELLIQ